MALVLTIEQYELIIDTIRDGFEHDGVKYKPNNRIATLLVAMANLGLRVGDMVDLRLNSFVKDGNRYRLDIIEEKTRKKREFTVPMEIYNFIKMYMLESGIKETAKLFDISVRAVQKHLKATCNYLGLEKISTHSFRKYFATNIYVNNNYNIMLVKELLQHTEVKTTQRYIGVSSKEIEKALQGHIQLR